MRIAIDIDSTLHHYWDELAGSAKRRFGVDLPYEQQHTWIVGQYRYPHRAYSWEIPEGGGPVGEEPLLSAQRELAEEVGLSARRWRVPCAKAAASCTCGQLTTRPRSAATPSWA